jgi:hypothetical protein
MNGRIYDPLLGRMLSADVVVQAPGNLQAYNRYSYVMNNPLTLIDPSGWAGARPGSVGPVSGMAAFETEILERDLREMKDASGELGEANARRDYRAADAAKARLDTIIVRQGGDPRNPMPLPECELRPTRSEPAQAARNQTESAARRVDAPKQNVENLGAAAPETSPEARISFDPPAASTASSNGQPSTPIRGNAQVTSPGHAETSQQLANEIVAGGQATSVHLNQSLRTITQGAVSDLRRPDVASVNGNGAVTMIEVPSPSQTTSSQQAKVDSMVQALGPLAGPNSRVEPVRPPPPPPPPDPLTVHVRIP